MDISSGGCNLPDPHSRKWTKPALFIPRILMLMLSTRTAPLTHDPNLREALAVPVAINLGYLLWTIYHWLRNIWVLSK